MLSSALRGRGGTLGRSLPRLFSSQPAGALNSLDIEHFASIIGGHNVVTDAQELEVYNTDWMRKYRGNSKVALRPGSTADVSAILMHCNKRRIPVVPQGGNTGLVGGSVPVDDEVVVSLSRMNQVLSLDEHAGNLICQSGCVLESLQNYVWERGYTMPLDLGAKGSCQIGGNIATNAGGLRYLRYGSLHGTVLGLEVVLADGTVLDNLSALRKDNTGYDLKQLFIGSEGTLGIITACAMALPRAPKSIQLAYLGCDSYEAVLQTFASAKRDLGEVLSAIEFLDRESLELVAGHAEGFRDPLEHKCRHYMLVELSGSNEAHDVEKLEAFLEGVMEDGYVRDGTVASSADQSAHIWSIREGITEALSKSGRVYKYDVSIPLDQLYSLVEVMRDRLAPVGAEVSGFGHLGDGNLHLNIHTPGVFHKASLGHLPLLWPTGGSRPLARLMYPHQVSFDHPLPYPHHVNLDSSPPSLMYPSHQVDAVQDAIEPYVFEWIAERRGSISAEHGVGVMKPPFLHMSKSAGMIDMMRGIKNMLDPNGILNPHKVLPPLQAALNERAA